METGLLLNLDKRQMLFRHGQDYLVTSAPYEFNPSLCEKLFWLLLSKHHTHSWAGNRIIWVDHCLTEYPEGMLTNKELEDLETSNMYDTALANYVEAQVPGTPTPLNSVCILRNLSRQEYVRSDAVEEFGPPQSGLIKALLARSFWSSKRAPDVLRPQWAGIRTAHRGIWAGSRFDIVAHADFQGIYSGAWRDVSAGARKEIIGFFPSSITNINVDSRKTSLFNAPFRPCNHDVMRMIMEIAAKDDVSDAISLAGVSWRTYEWVVPFIYCAIMLDSEEKLGSFRNALDNNSVLGPKVRRLFVSPFFETSAPEVDDVLLKIRWPSNTESNTDHLSAVLRHCKNLEVLITNMDLSDISRKGFLPPVRHVMTTPRGCAYNLPHRLRDHQFLHNITHLCLSPDLPEWKALRKLLTSSLQSLTHLALFCGVTGNQLKYFPLIQELLKNNSTLQVILLIVDSNTDIPKAPPVGEFWPQLATIDDYRLFARCGVDVDEYNDILKYGTSVFDDVETKYQNWRNLVSAT